MINRHWRAILALIVVPLLALSLGCGSNGAGVDDWTVPPPITAVGAVTGRVQAPIAGVTSMRDAALFVAPGGAAVRGAGLGGVSVFIESRPDLAAVTAADGSFVIQNVPLGSHRVIAETLVNGRSHKQRSDVFSIAVAGQVTPLAADMQLVPAPRLIELVLLDGATGVGVPLADCYLWGHKTLTGSTGSVTLGPVPAGAWPIHLAAVGYRDRDVVVSFDARRAHSLQLFLTPKTAVDSNQSPLVEVQAEFASLLTYQTGGFVANAQDPEGDNITFEWWAQAGSFAQTTGPTNIYTAPPVPGTYTIAVIARDPRGGWGRALSTVQVMGGGNPVTPGNRAPANPTIVFPEDGATDMGTEVELRWAGSDPDGDALTYDVYLGFPGQELVQIAQGLTTPVATARGLGENILYFWRVVARDPSGAINPQSPVWQFRTGIGPNNPPNVPSNPTPQDLAQGQTPALLLSWYGGDPDADDRVEYTVLLATGNADLIVASTTRLPRYPLEGLGQGVEYEWQVVARDRRGAARPSPRWRFSTARPPNLPPQDPIAVYPSSGSRDIEVLPRMVWSSTDPDGDALTYEMYLGTATPLVRKVASSAAAVFVPDQALEPATKYFWQVVARDDRGGVNPTTTVFSFTTRSNVNLYPGIPSAPQPASGAANVDVSPVLSWSAVDPNGDLLTYDVFLDTASTPNRMVARDLTRPLFAVAPALTAGTTYYWQVEARDPSGATTRSPVWSFTTMVALDTQQPRVLAVGPAVGAVKVPRNSLIEVTFSEAMDHVSVENALQFDPPLRGTFTWDGDARVRFLPSQPLASGCYYVVTVAASARDQATNLMVNPYSWSFTVDSSLPLPSSLRSPGFGVLVPAGGQASFTVSGILTGQQMSALLVADVATATVGVAGSQRLRVGADLPVPPQFAECHEAFARELERHLPPWRPEVEAAVVAKQQAVYGNIKAGQTVGAKQQFYISAFNQIATTTPYPSNKIEAECVAATSLLLLYVDTAITSPDANLIARIRAEFEEKIQPRVRDQFGNEPAAGPDGESRLTILLTNAMSPNILGLFYAADLFGRNTIDAQLRESNQRKLFYMRYADAYAYNPTLSELNRFGTMAHEFQHMVNFYQKQRAGGNNVFEDTWLNEGLSKYSEEVCGYGMIQGERNTAEIVQGSLRRMNQMSLTDWQNVWNYGYSYLFVRFLAENNRYQTTSREVTRALVQSARTGVSNVGAITGEPFERTRARFGLCLMLNRFGSTGNDYGLSGLDLTGQYASVRLPGVPWLTGAVGALNVPGNGMAFWMRPGSTGTPLRLTVTNPSTPLTAWVVDPRP